MDADGSHPRLITRLATEAGGFAGLPRRKKDCVPVERLSECGADNACNQRNLDADAKAPSKARIFTSLLYRHWTEWQTRRRQHLLVADTTAPTSMTSRRASMTCRRSRSAARWLRDFTRFAGAGLRRQPGPGARGQYQLRYLYRPIDGGDARKITISPGADDSPLYSPDGKYLAYRSQPRAGYESDRWRLMVLERATGHAMNLTESLDRWVESFTWSPDSTRLFFTTEDRGRTGLQMISATAAACAASSAANRVSTTCSSPPTAAP